MADTTEATVVEDVAEAPNTEAPTDESNDVPITDAPAEESGKAM